jgi:hypothetical protein
MIGSRLPMRIDARPNRLFIAPDNDAIDQPVGSASRNIGIGKP